MIDYRVQRRPLQPPQHVLRLRLPLPGRRRPVVLLDGRRARRLPSVVLTISVARYR